MLRCFLIRMVRGAIEPAQKTIADENGDPLQQVLFSRAEISKSNDLIRQWIHRQNHPEYIAIHTHEPQGLRLLQHSMWKLRNIFRLMSLPVEFQLKDGVATLSGKSFHIECEVGEGAAREPISGTGTIEFVFVYPGYYYAPVLVTKFWNLPLHERVDDETTKQFDRGLGSISELARSIHEDQQLSQWLSETKHRILPGEGWEKFGQEVEAAVTGVFLPRVSLYFAPTQPAAFAAACGSDGLFGIFQDAEVLRAAALVSTLAAFEPSLEEFEADLSRFGLERDTIPHINGGQSPLIAA